MKLKEKKRRITSEFLIFALTHHPSSPWYMTGCPMYGSPVFDILSVSVSDKEYSISLPFGLVKKKRMNKNEKKKNKLNN